MKRFIIMMAVLSVFFSLTATSVLADTERESIMEGTHELAWAYFMGEHERWYISYTLMNNFYTGNVYSLTPIKDGKAGWGTVGEGVATVDLENHRVSVEDNLDSDPSDRYYDAGWKEWVENASIHQDRQWIQGKTVSIAWYFFYVKETNHWYIINAPGYESGTRILRFSERNGEYDWIETDTEDLNPVFFIEDAILHLKFGNGLQQEGLMPPGHVFDQLSYFVYKPKPEYALNWACLLGGWQHAGMYLGTTTEGERLIIHATGKLNVPPTIEPLDEFLRSKDGIIDEMVWLTPNNISSAEYFNVFTIASSLTAPYPAVREDLAADALEEIRDASSLGGFFHAVGEGYHNASLLIESFGPKDPVELGIPSEEQTLYCSQLVYMVFKYGAGIDLESDTDKFLDYFDRENRLVTPVDLIYGTNKRILYWFKDNNIGLPVVNTTVEGKNVTIYWGTSQGQSEPDGWDIYLRNSAGNVSRLPMEAELSNHTMELSTGDYDATVVPHGDSGPILEPDQHEWKSFHID